MMTETYKNAGKQPLTFKAPTMQEVLELVREKVGSEALVLSTRTVNSGPGWQVWRKPIVEVVVLPPDQPKPEPRADHNSVEPLIAELLQQKRSVKQADAEPEWEPVEAKPQRPEPQQAKYQSPILKEIENRLVYQGVDAEIIRSVVSSCSKTLSPYAIVDPRRVKSYLKQQLGTMLRFNKKETQQPEVICLVGSTGVGKTETTAKLLAYYRNIKGLQVAWINADTIRMGAIAQAQTYAASLDVELHHIYSAEEAEEIIQDVQKRVDLIIVDTPGINPNVEEQLVSLGEILMAFANRTTYTVVSATMNEQSLRNTFTAFSPFSPEGIVVTKMDESEVYGPVFNAVRDTRVPILYLTNGIQLFDNLHEASAMKFAGAILGDEKVL